MSSVKIQKVIILFSLVVFKTQAFGTLPRHRRVALIEKKILDASGFSDESVSPAHETETPTELPTDLNHSEVLHQALRNLSVELEKLTHVFPFDHSRFKFPDELKSSISAVKEQMAKALLVVNEFLHSKQVAPPTPTFTMSHKNKNSVPLKFLGLSLDYHKNNLNNKKINKRLDSLSSTNLLKYGENTINTRSNFKRKHIHISGEDTLVTQQSNDEETSENFETPVVTEGSLNYIYKSSWNPGVNNVAKFYISNVINDSDEVNSIIYNLTSIADAANEDLKINLSTLEKKSPSMIMESKDVFLSPIMLKSEKLLTTNSLILDIPRTSTPSRSTQSLVIRKRNKHGIPTESNNNDTTEGVIGFDDSNVNSWSHEQKNDTLSNQMVHSENGDAKIDFKLDDDSDQWSFGSKMSADDIFQRRNSNSECGKKLKFGMRKMIKQMNKLKGKPSQSKSTNEQDRNQHLKSTATPADVSDQLNTKLGHQPYSPRSVDRNISSELKKNEESEMLAQEEDNDFYDDMDNFLTFKIFGEDDKVCDDDNDENSEIKAYKREKMTVKLQDDISTVQTNISNIIKLLKNYSVDAEADELASELASNIDEFFAKMKSLLNHVRTGKGRRSRKIIWDNDLPGSRSFAETEVECDNDLRIYSEDHNLLRKKIHELSTNPFSISTLKESLCSLVSVHQTLIKAQLEGKKAFVQQQHIRQRSRRSQIF